MELIEVLTLIGAVMVSLSVLGGLGALLWRGGQSEQRRVSGREEIMGSLGDINGHLKTLNGSVAEVTKLAHENSLKIARIQGALHPDGVPPP